MPMMPTCRDITRQTTAYDEGGLPWTERLAFRVHILMCRHCSRYLAQMRRIRRQTAELFGRPAPPAAKERALEAFRQRSRS
ncbi:MAG: zf-HC2 domain-containing protein [Vicinamibacterales bacterium]